MNRQPRLAQINRQIGKSDLYWFGTRGSDGQALACLESYQGAFGYICPDPDQPEHGLSYSLETKKLLRVDLNRYDIDNDASTETALMRDNLMLALSRPSVILPYRPSLFLSSMVFPRRHTVKYAGMFFLKQLCYEYKPWTETELEKFGVNILPWRYYGENEIFRFLKETGDEPIVLRVSRGAGGVGIIRVEAPRDAVSFCKHNKDSFFAVSTFLNPNLPISVNAVVFDNAETIVFPPTAQLVGLETCTTRNLGYCGNDSGPIRSLPDSILDDIQKMTKKIGRWLRSTGYLGAFGVDLLLHEEELFMAEVNPRFLASSPFVARLCAKRGYTDPFLEHIAAYYRLPPLRQLPLAEQIKDIEPMAQVFCFNRGSQAIRRQPGDLDPDDPEVSIEDYPKTEVAVEVNAQLFKAVFHRSITDDGWSIRERDRTLLKKLVEQWILGPIH